MSENNQSTPAEDSPTASLDIDRVNADDWPVREFPIDDGRRENSVRVVIKQSVLNDIHAHGQSTTDVEICGVLVGAGYRDERGPYVFVEANIRGQHSDSKAAQVTFTGETWNHIHNELDRDYPDLQILGWYHTHPGFGIFLSGMDLFIHENYFTGEQQLAFVYDPIGGDEGLFVWRGGKAVRDGFLVQPDAEEDPPPVAAGPPNEPVTAGAMTIDETPAALANGPDDADLASRLSRIEKRQSLADVMSAVAMVMAVAVPLGIWAFWIKPRLPAPGEPPPQQRAEPRTEAEPEPNPSAGTQREGTTPSADPDTGIAEPTMDAESDLELNDNSDGEAQDADEPVADDPADAESDTGDTSD